MEWFNPAHRAFLASWSDGTGDHAGVLPGTEVVDGSTVLPPAETMDRFVQQVRAADVLVAHNLPFDAHMLRETVGFDVFKQGKLVVDTDILARVVVPERRTAGDEENDRSAHGFKLEDLSKTYLPDDEQKIGASLEELAKQAGIKLKATGGYYDVWRAFPEQFEEYARRDTRATRALLPKLEAKLSERLTPTWTLERTVQPHLIAAESRGVAVDQAKIEPLKKTYTAKRDEAYDACLKTFGAGVLADPDDPDSKENADALREALLSAGVPLHRKVASCTHKGACDCGLATNKFALQEFAAEYPVIQSLFDYRQARKFLATYIGPMDGRDVVHPTYWQIGAWTGRMSCSRPNMQNIPVRGEGSSELRAMFVPRPGHVLVVSDFDAIEARLLAYYLGTRGVEYRAMIEHGHDVHSWMASKIWGGSPAEYAKGGPKDKLRALAKNVLFAIVYGAGGGRVLDMLLDAGLAKNSVHDGWYPGKTGPRCKCDGCALAKDIKSAVPGYWELSKRVRRKVEEVGSVNTILGRRQPVKKDKGYVGLNAIIQGSAADIFKQAIVNVSEAVAPLGAQPILFVHDEIGTECPVEHAAECLQLQNAAMMEAYDLSPTLAVTGTICHHNYSEGK